MTDATAEVEIQWTRYGPSFYCAHCLAHMDQREGFLIHPEEAGKRSRKPGFAHCPHIGKWFKRPFYRIPVTQTAAGTAPGSSTADTVWGWFTAIICIVLFVVMVAVASEWWGKSPATTTPEPGTSQLTEKDLGVSLPPRPRAVESMKDGEDAWINYVISFSGRLYVNSKSELQPLMSSPSGDLFAHIKKVKGGFMLKECPARRIDNDNDPGNEWVYKDGKIIGRFE